MSKNILIIDDDVDFAEIHRTALEARGYAVRHAFNGTEGVAMAQAERPDLVLLDLMMEHADAGFIVARKLKGDPKTADVPILMLSGVARETGLKFDLDSAADRQWIKADMFLDKPIRSEELVARVAALLGESRH
jgi:DNA-binding response OmpR family regulator